MIEPKGRAAAREGGGEAGGSEGARNQRLSEEGKTAD